MNKFAILSERENDEPFYNVGPWGTGNRYTEPALEDRLSRELIDLEDWLRPTPAELELRLLTIMRFTNVIEAEFPGAIVIPQGSSATETLLPTSDIDLIVVNLPEADPVEILRSLSRLFQKSKIASRSFVIPHAAVPVTKLIERPYGFHVDICATNINGVLNIDRVKRVIAHHPMVRPLLMFMKLFVWVYAIDDPAKGGFGSNQLVLLVHAILQTNPNVKSVGEALLYMLDVIGHRLNYFMVGLSTVAGGRLVSKREHGLSSGAFPAALCVEDAQFHGRFIGIRTSSTTIFASACRSALLGLKGSDCNIISGLTSFLRNVNGIIARRREIERFASLLHGPKKYFAAAVDQVPLFVPGLSNTGKNQKRVPEVRTPPVYKKPNVNAKQQRNRQHQHADHAWDDFVVKKYAKRERKMQIAEARRERAREKRHGSEELFQAAMSHVPKHDKHARKATPPRFRR